MKINENFDKVKVLNYMFIGIMGLVVAGMLSSFVMRMSAPPIDAKIESDIVKSTVEEVIQVNVLNGCGVPGLAGKAQQYLRSRGFDVVEIGNTETVIEKSQVIDRVGDQISAMKVAYALGLADSTVTSNIDSSLFLRATIVIGNDYKELNPFH